MEKQRPLKGKISIMLDSDLIDILRKLAEKDDRTLSQYVNCTLKKHVESLEK